MQKRPPQKRDPLWVDNVLDDHEEKKWKAALMRPPCAAQVHYVDAGLNSRGAYLTQHITGRLGAPALPQQ